MGREKVPATARRIAGKCLAVRLRSVNRAVTRIYDDALRPHGIKVGQMNILVVTANLGTAHPADVAGLLQLKMSTLSRNVERLRVQGWIEEVPQKDARVRPFRITPKGRKLLEQTRPAWERAQRQAARLLGPEGVEFLNQAATRVSPGLGAGREG